MRYFNTAGPVVAADHYASESLRLGDLRSGRRDRRLGLYVPASNW